MAPSLNLWRHALIWYGGMGIIVLVVAILPMLGVGGMQLYKAEHPDRSRTKTDAAHRADGARVVGRVPACITVGMHPEPARRRHGWFDAVCHAFSIMGLGGFSTHDASVGYFDSCRSNSCHRVHA
jgi:trk system potassium uptake protein TrkH